MRVGDSDVVELGGDSSGTDLGDPDAGAAQLKTKVGAKAVDRCLGRPVGRRRERVETRHGSEIDHVTRSTADHRRQKGHRGDHQGGDVGVDRAADVIESSLSKGAVHPAETSVVDQHVNVSNLLRKSHDGS